jgi:hypothetical protein
VAGQAGAGKAHSRRQQARNASFTLAGHLQRVIPRRILHDEERFCLRKCIGVVTA